MPRGIMWTCVWWCIVYDNTKLVCLCWQKIASRLDLPSIEADRNIIRTQLQSVRSLLYWLSVLMCWCNSNLCLHVLAFEWGRCGDSKRFLWCVSLSGPWQDLCLDHHSTNDLSTLIFFTVIVVVSVILTYQCLLLSVIIVVVNLLYHGTDVPQLWLCSYTCAR